MCETYNGWTNRETWATALWIDNDYGWYTRMTELVADAVQSHDDEQREGCTDCRQGDHSEDCQTDLDALEPIAGYVIADLIKDNVEGLLDPDAYESEYGTAQPTEIAKIGYDIGSLYRVNWDEIAEHYLAV